MDDEINEKRHCPYVICFITEFIGTWVLVFIGCMSCLWEYEMGPAIPAFCFGLIILTIVQIFGHISPVHINPAVSLGVFILGKMDWKQLLVYLLAQYTGGMLGSFALKMVMPIAPDLCVLSTNMNITEVQGFFIEFWSTFILFMTVAAVIHPKNEEHIDSVPIRIGLMITALVLAAGSFTGAGLNPARAFAPAVIYNAWREHWLYHSAPYAGMATAALLSRFVFDSNEKNSLYAFLDRKGM